MLGKKPLAIWKPSAVSLTAVAPVRHELQFDPATFPDATPAASDGTRRRADSGVFYGWLMVLLTTVVLIASSPGQTFGFTYFNPSLRQALSISQTELSVTYLCATLVAALPLGYCGAVVDRVGLKRSMLAAVAAMSAACLLSAAVQNVPMLFVACLAMRLVGPGVMTLLANHTLAAWFDARLGAATSVLQLGMAAAMALAPLGIMTLIAQVGWRQSYAVLGAILAVGVFPLVWWAFREDPRELGQTRDGLAGPLTDGQAAGFRRDHTAWAAHESPADAASYDLRAARRTAAFWVFLMATSVWSLIGTGYVFHLQPLLESRGLTPAAIAWATPLMASAMATMQLAGGRLPGRQRVDAGRRGQRHPGRGPRGRAAGGLWHLRPRAGPDGAGVDDRVGPLLRPGPLGTNSRNGADRGHLGQRCGTAGNGDRRGLFRRLRAVVVAVRRDGAGDFGDLPIGAAADGGSAVGDAGGVGDASAGAGPAPQGFV
ncbi:MAG TPA: MFS transporter, partial [Lacipirellulaceae bacterium]|nr:MFS transporter [Lacipirellulaceae bacterium]